MVLNGNEVDRIPPGIPGVYLLHAKAVWYGGYATFYAGKSIDLQRRLREHLARRAKPSIRAARELDAAYWSAAPVFSATERSRIESALIRALEPPCNSQVPFAVPRIVDLPALSLLDFYLSKEDEDED
jgi:predicted GIY-YIG superfamily endonuclease